ncbi:hypothetical protein EHS25_004244 [Saitozyma podzolica]|uniref:DNA polymerase delta subunit 4 n=1 Tax=Saitozyma podzolica TaxID=1890683 RepID=A0A427YTX0_9TREE|nr:hypothetical protein EHS25_004244 [Saitozyma podzolica]
MPPRKSAGRTKKAAAGLSQPTLSFSSRKPSTSDTLAKPLSKAQSRSTASLGPSASEVSIPSTAPDSDVEPTPDAEERALREKGRKDAEDKEKARRGGRRTLDPKSKEWEGLTREAKKAMGGMQPIHAGPDTHNNVHHILRVFDMTSKYGPCVGITRLERWERANKWGLNPPEEIREILTTAQGEDDASYRENVLSTWL